MDSTSSSPVRWTTVAFDVHADTRAVDAATEEDQESFFTLKSVEVSLSNFDISIHDSLHPVRNFFAKPALRTYIEARFVDALQEFIGSAFASFDRELFVLQQRAIGVGHGAPDLASYLQAIFSVPFAGAGDAGVEATSDGMGITKISKDGDSILAIGVTEELLPGKLTGLGRKGKDVVARKQNLEVLAEEGRSTYQDGVAAVGTLVEDITGEGERVEAEYAARRRLEAKRDGWKSSAFDL